MSEPSARPARAAPTFGRVLERLRSKRHELADTRLPRRAAPEQPALLSFAQQRLWFLHQLEPDSRAYNIPVALALSGALNVKALRAALTRVVERHEVLRSTFIAIDGEPHQKLSPRAEVALPVVDLSRLAPERRRATVPELLQRAVGRAFDLERGPLLRASLLRWGEQEAAILLEMHHIVSDGWSMGILLREVSAFYQAALDGAAPRIAPLPVQYADFAAWQRRRLNDEALAAELDYWRRQLAGAPSLIEIPTDRPRPSQQSYHGAHAALRLPAGAADAVGALAERLGTTRFMVLLAAAAVLYARHASQDDVSIGTSLAGREQAETKDLIGFFVNTLVLRFRLEDEPTFTALVARAREVLLDAHRHQELPFERIVSELVPQRSLAHSPLFQVMFVQQTAPGVPLSLPGLELSLLEASTETAKYDLILALHDEEGRALGLVYNADLFDATTAQRLLQRFAVLARELAARPERPVFAAALLEPAERAQLLWEWNDSAAPAGETSVNESCVHELFARQAARTPDRVALVAGEERLSYGELEARANRLARYLTAHGVVPEVPVVLLLDRVLELVVAIWGTLKAGAPYAAVAPATPIDRLETILASARSTMLLTRAALAPPAFENQGGLDATGGVEVLALDTEWSRVEAHDGSPPPNRAVPANAAYVIFTSGSTGTPKGVVVEHRQLLHFLRNLAEQARFEPDWDFALVQPASVDSSKTTLYPPLLAGGALHLVSEHEAVDAAALGRTMRERGIEFLKIAPSHLRALEEVNDDGSIYPTRCLIFGGEASFRDWAEELAARVPGRGLFSNYGPSETTVGSSMYRVEAGRLHAISRLPLGRPFRNIRYYPLDRRGRLVPIGVAGELYIGGAGVTRGYLARPALTAERYVPDPFSGGFGERLYRSGDLVRYLPDGELEFLGRTDHQVKIRGFRIELGEIEAVLQKHPAVRAAAVISWRDPAGVDRLAAYVVATEDGLAATALAAHAASALPEYMVPASFVFLPELPRLPHGKLDRRALPEPELPAVAAAEPAQLATAVERTLAEIWSGVLGQPRVGRDDNFFDLGGHSLLATQAISRIRQALAVELPLRDLFEAATLGALAERIERLRTAGPAAGAAAGKTAPPILARDRQDARETALPLSFAQQRLWFLAQLQPQSSFYNIPRALRLEGPLDARALARTFAEIVRRHEVLRTRFPAVDGEPIQVIAPPSATSRPRLIDLSGLGAEAREAKARKLADLEARRPFDLATGPMLRLTLVRLERQAHVALLTLHHIVSDGWSTGILIDEVGALYRELAAGRPSPLPELGVQYADYALWQRDWLRGETLAAEVAHWKARLAGVRPALDLPTDRPRPPVQTFNGAVASLTLPPALAAGLRALSRAKSVTLFPTLLAGFAALVSRWTGALDLCIATPVAGRTRVEIEPLIGFFINTLPLRLDLGGEPSFERLLERASDVSLEADQHQDLPYEKLVEEVQPERNLAHSPLCQVMFVLQNTPRGELRLGELSLQVLEVHSGSTKFDFTLGADENAGALTLVYNTDLFDATTMRRLLGHFATLAAGAVAAPDTPLAALPLLTPAERAQLLVEWNDSARETNHDELVHRGFERQAAATPDRVAILCDDERWSYDELNRRANRLAHALLERGAGPEVPVGLFSERKWEMVVGLWGILKTGGCYAAFSPTTPGERVLATLERAGASVVLTRRSLAPALADVETASSLEILVLDSPSGRFEEKGEENPAGTALPENTAYLLHTSGSTGLPKGVVVEHRQLLHFLDNLKREAALGDDWSYAIVQPPAVDSSKTTLYPPLLTGGCLHVISEERATDIEAMADYMSTRRVDFLKIAPSHLSVLMSTELWADVLPRQCLIFGGEASYRDWAVQLRERAAGRTLFSNYGPTETTVGSSMYRLEQGAIAPTPTLPLGRPFANIRYHVLDRALRPVPIGVVGEIYIAGDGVTRGYLRQPALTAERYLPNPFAETPGDRLYRSGDLARYLADGDLEFFGRADHQVKIRGFRVELGEIEAALGRQEGVAACAVVVWEDAQGEKRLAAYVVAALEGLLEAASLRAALQQALPEHMVPASFTFLPELPRLAHGKLDRRALPAPELSTESGAFQPPRGAVEHTLAEIWSEVLGVETVGRDDNFFALGGHSLLATQVVSRIRKALEVELPLRDLFEAADLAELALRCAGGAKDEAGDALLGAPPLVPVPRAEDGMPLSFAQQRLWFLDRLEPGSSVYSIPRALRLEGELDARALARTFAEVLRRHEVLRTTFHLEGGEPVQRIGRPAPPDLGVVDLSALAPAERERGAEALARREARRPFDLEHGPLLRLRLMRLDGQTHLLLLNVHHIVSDGWSTGVLIREVSALYLAFRTGEPASLAPLPIQYADFAHWQRGWLRGEVLAAEIEHWRGALAGAPPFLTLPTDRPRPRLQTFRGAALDRTLGPTRASALAAFARGESLTLFPVLMAAFQLVLLRHSGQRDLLVATPVAGRHRLEVEPLIGCFVNTLAIRGRLDSARTPRELVHQVNTAALEAFRHQDLPFEKLIEELQPERSLSAPPLCQVMLVLQNTPRDELDLAGVRLRLLALEGETSKFDLALAVDEDASALNLSYNTDLFDRTTMARLLGAIERLLSSIVEAPDAELESLSLLAPSERHQLLHEWNDSASELPSATTLHAVVARRLAEAPDATCLVFEGAHLSAGAVSLLAGRLATRLRALGVGPGARVGLASERALELPVGLLGVLASGAAYVPFEPSYPLERLRFMLEDAGLSALVAQQEVLPRLGELALPVLLLEDLYLEDLYAGTVSGENSSLAEAAHPEVSPDDPAYMIYTSGSTGRPKGAVNAHRAVLNRLLWEQERFALDRRERFLQKTPFSFDVSVEELFNPFLAGAPLVLAKPGGHQDVSYLVDLIARERITTAHFVPSMLQVFLESPELDRCDALVRVKAAGEALPPELARRALERLGVPVHNLYGPTEAAIEVSHWTSEGGIPRAAVPIGRPISNARLHVLDHRLCPRPIGVTGELYLGGTPVGDGYAGRPALTAERFVPDPFSAVPGARLYRTGDLARVLPSGEVDYLGRADHQIKLRGFRIELGEIESALSAHPRVREAVVVLRKDEPGLERLVAYVVPPSEAPAGTLTGPALASFLAPRLPDHMVPSLFVELDSLPLTPSGKVNRALLPAPASARGSAYLAPRDETELALVGIWEELFGRGPIGVRDGFFELGGHSLAAVRVQSRIAARLGHALPLAALFDNPTIEALAAAVRRQARGAAPSPPPSPLVVLNPRRSEIESGALPFFCVHPVGGQVLCYLELARALGRAQPVFGLRSAPADDDGAPATIEAMAEVFVEAIRGEQAHGPYQLGGWSMGGLIALEIARRLRALGEEVRALVLIDTAAPTPAWRAREVEASELPLLFARDLAATWGLADDESALDLAALRALPELEAVARLAARGRALGGPAAELGPAAFEEMYLVFRRNHRAARAYEPAPYDGAVQLLMAERDGAGGEEYRQGWGPTLRGELEIRSISGDHHSILRPPRVAALADRVRASLALGGELAHSGTGS